MNMDCLVGKTIERVELNLEYDGWVYLYFTDGTMVEFMADTCGCGGLRVTLRGMYE